MFNLVPRQRNPRQVAGRNLTDILRLKQDALGGAFGEVDEYGKRKRGEAIMEQIAGLSPEERAKTDFMALGGKGTQSEQTMDILKDLAGKQEKQKGRDFTAEENAKSRATSKLIASMKAKTDEGIQLNPTETKGLIDGLKTVDRDLALLRGQISSAKARDKAGIISRINDLQRQKINMERMLDPDYSKGVETESFKRSGPTPFDLGQMFPIKKEYKKK